MHDANTHKTALGLPSHIEACLFDLDGVLTDTAKLHAQAWKQVFDSFLAKRSRTDGTPVIPFDMERDFEQYLDGRLRAEGARAFLRSRNISIPEGTRGDTARAETIQGLSERKNEILVGLLRDEGVEAFPGSVRYLDEVRRADLRTAVVSSSTNGHDVVAAAGLAGLIDTRVDGVVARERHLPGKPAPDTYLAAAQALGVDPANAAVFEDALAGVAAGRAGGFGFVVGVDRAGKDRADKADALRSHGADLVVKELSALLGAT